MTDIFQIDTSDVDLSDGKFDRHYEREEDDPFQASMIALHGSTCSADLTYQMAMQASTPQVFILELNLSTNSRAELFIFNLLCFRISNPTIFPIEPVLQ